MDDIPVVPRDKILPPRGGSGIVYPKHFLETEQGRRVSVALHVIRVTGTQSGTPLGDAAEKVLIDYLKGE